jgi:hypothetical protein
VGAIAKVSFGVWVERDSDCYVYKRKHLEQRIVRTAITSGLLRLLKNLISTRGGSSPDRRLVE